MALVEIFTAVVVIIVLLVGGALGIEKYASIHGKTYWKKRRIPSFGIEEMGSMWLNVVRKKRFTDQTTEFYQRYQNENINEPYVGGMKFLTPNLWVFDLDLMRCIMVKNFEHFVNRTSSTSTMFKDDSDPHFTLMLIFRENQEWKDLRSTMSPTFTTGRIREMFDIFGTSCDRMITYLTEKSGTNGGRVNMSDTVVRLAMDIIAGSAFGVESRAFVEDDPIFTRMGRKYGFKIKLSLFAKMVLNSISPSLYKLLGFNVMDKDADAFFTHIIKSAIKHRETTGEKRNDFIQLMLQARAGQLKDTGINEDEDADVVRPTGGKRINLSDDSIVAQSLLFILGGFDTVSSALNFAVYNLAFHPDIQEKISKQVGESVKANGGKLTYEAVSQLEYLDMFVSESLRLYPPAFILERGCNQDFEIPGSDGLIIPNGAIIDFPVFAIQRDPKHFPDPLKFDPERFSTENKRHRHPYAFTPFGHGPRNCIAMRFAMIEVKTIVASLAYNVIIEPTVETPVPSKLKFSTDTTLRPESDFMFNIKVRKH